jgi:hypothetical protein
MAVLAYHLDGLRVATRWLAVIALANGLLPWPLGVVVGSALDYAMRASLGHHLRLVMPEDVQGLIGLAVAMGTLSGLSWWSGRLMGQRRWRGVSLAIAAAQLWYLPWGTFVAVRAARLLIFRPDVRALYRLSRGASDPDAAVGTTPSVDPAWPVSNVRCHNEE